MPKKLILFIVVAFFSSFGLAHAQIVINEIQVLPTGEKFLELYNIGDSSVDLTNWQIKKKTQSGTESVLVSQARLENKSISAGGYFLIANENNYTGQGVVNASWPPSNTGVASNNTVFLYQEDILIDKFGWGEASDCQSPCPPNPTTGQSLQKNSNSWITDIPTPRAANTQSTPPPPQAPAPSSGGGGGGPTPAPSSTATTTTKPPEPQKIRAQIVAKTLAFAGQPASFEGLAYGTNGEKLFNGRYFWNFGDGSSREIKNSESPKFTHTYFYPGDYTVSLEFFTNYYGDIPDAITQVSVRVVSADIVISNVGNEADFFIELSNNTAYDTDISRWTLSGFNRLFSFPKNTILGSKKKVIFSSRVTGFMLSDKESLKLLDSQSQTVFNYGESLISAPIVIPVQERVVAVARTNKSLRAAPRIIEKEPVVIEQVVSGNITASIISSEVDETDENGAENSYIPIIVFGALLVLSAGAVYFIRQERAPLNEGDDFELLDE